LKANKILYTTGEAVIQSRRLISRSTISRYFDRRILKGEKNPITGKRMITKESIKRLLKKYHVEE